MAAEWNNPDDEKPVDDLGYSEIITISTTGNVHVWDIVSWINAWHAGDSTARHTFLWAYKPY